MMDICKMSDHEKSVMLAKAMGWKIYEFTHVMFYPLGYDPSNRISNLYDPAYMALAWRAIGVMVDRHTEIWDAFFDWWDLEIDPGHESAQRLWLDKILELVIKAGIIEEK